MHYPQFRTQLERMETEPCYISECCSTTLSYSWHRPTFVSQLNSQLPTYVSWKKGPTVMTVNAFTLGSDTILIHVSPVYYDREDIDENSTRHGKMRSKNCTFLAKSIVVANPAGSSSSDVAPTTGYPEESSRQISPTSCQQH